MEQSSLTGKNTRKEQSKTRQQARSPRQEQRLHDSPAAVQAALDALLAGAGLEQLPAEAVLALSGRIGNSTLLDLAARRQTGPRLAEGLPETQPWTEPLSCSPGQPQLEAAPGFAGMNGPAGSPLEL